MYDPPKGQVATVERLLQVLALLRQSDLGVPRSVLMERVQRYAESSASEAKPTAVLKMMELDVKALNEIGFRIEDVAAPGQESVFVLHPTAWQVPIDLTDVDKGLLAWVFRAVEVADAEDQPISMVTTAPDAYDALLGNVPEQLGLIQAALAGRRALVIDKNGDDQVIEPARLVMHARRWMMLARYPGSSQVSGYRVDGLNDVRLGELLAVPPQPVDALEVLDPTYWNVDHRTIEVALRCRTDDLALVQSWFPRAVVTAKGEQALLHFPVRNLDAVLDRVLGLAGAATLTAPPAAVQALRARLEPFLVTA